MKLTDEERAFIELKTEAVAALGITDEFAAREIVGHVERLINEAQAEMVERCIDEVEKMFSSVPADIRENECAVLATKSPDPNFLAHERLKAREDEFRDTVVALLSSDIDSKRYIEHRRDELKRELAALRPIASERQAAMGDGK